MTFIVYCYIVILLYCYILNLMKCVRFVCADPRFDKDIYIDAADIAPTVAGTHFLHHSWMK